MTPATASPTAYRRFKTWTGSVLLLGLVFLFAGNGLVLAALPKENVLVVGIPAEHGNLDPCYGGSPHTTEIVSAVYEQPVGFKIEERDGHRVQAIDDLNGWEPLLAESVEISDDGRVYTFHLRRGVRFYPSGNEMTAVDWVWSWQRQLSQPAIGWCIFENTEASIVRPEDVEAVDRYTVRITTERANPRTLPFMRLQMFSILDSAEVQRHATPNDPWATQWLAQNTAGTGPYYIASREPGSELVLAANPHYWGERPAYDRVVIRTVSDTSTRIALLTRGDLDMVTNVPARLAERMRGRPGVDVLSVPSGDRVYIAFNVTKPPFDQLALRRAVAHAVPYQAIIDGVYHGSARRYDSFVLSEIPGYTGAGFDATFNLDKARTFLQDADTLTDRTLSLKINAAIPEHEEIALLLQDYLGRIGIEVTIEKLPSADFTNRVFAKELDFFIHQGISWIDDPSTIAGLWMESGAYGNFTRFASDEVDALHQTWRFEPYGPERNAAYQRIQELYNQSLTAVYLVLADHIVLMRDDVDGYVLYKDTGTRYVHMRPKGQ